MATKLKTNKAMRLGSVMLVLALLTTCAISGTFAKYTTESSASDTARVAKWGIGDTTFTISDLFQKAYDIDATVANQTVKSSGEIDGVTDVIAPGTKNSVTFNVANPTTAPEVDYTFAVTTTGSSIADDIKSNPDITWTFDTTTGLTWDQLMNKIKALGSDDIIKAGNFPSSSTSGTHTIGWEWAFEDAGQTDTQDELDTQMGNKSSLDQVKIVINIEATQVD